MRLGLLGPAVEHEELLARAARALWRDLGAERVIYLGADRALDAVVEGWAAELVGADAGDESIVRRATASCLTASPAEIDAYIRREQERASLRIFESLAGDTTRSVELIAGKVAVMLHDKAHLEEDDILPATLLVFGKSREPMIKQVGRRWFLSPGTFPKYGIMVIDDEQEDLRATTYDAEFGVRESRVLEAPRGLRMHVVGDR